MTQACDFTLRAAEPRDLPDLVRLIAALADYEKLTHLFDATPEKLGLHLFGDKAVVEAMVAELADGSVVGFALYFTNFSTFLCRPGLHLEDLFVLPQHRQLGIGRAMLQALARLAVERGCGRFEWSVLDWNEPAIRFYEKMGATVLPDWRICRMTGETLDAFARG
jgi:GNAT superfamily N-acetyltransferase